MKKNWILALLLDKGFEEVYVAGKNVRSFRIPDGSKVYRATFGDDTASVLFEFFASEPDGKNMMLTTLGR